MLNPALRRIGVTSPLSHLGIPCRLNRSQPLFLLLRGNDNFRLAPFPRYQLQRRPFTAYTRFRDRFIEARKTIWQDHPISLITGIIFAASSVSLLIYVVYDHVTRVEPMLAKFPKPVSDKLRRAIYYTEIDLNPVRALQWYKQALIVADQVDMHPFSEEVLGIRVQTTQMLEKAGMVKQAIEILEKTQKDCLEWVDNGRRKDQIRKRERNAAEQRSDGSISKDLENLENENLLLEERYRGFATKTAAGIGVKLAELYSSDYIREPEKAEKALINAITISRTELQRRRDMNLPVTQAEGSYYLNLTQIAYAFNEVADHFVRRGRNDLAAALYMQSLALIKEEEQESQTTCTQVVLLNNISSQMAEQAQTLNSAKAAATTGSYLPPISRDQLLSAASEWARKALEIANTIQAPIRTPECDQGCITAAYNLGEIAEMQGHFNEAKKYYTETKLLAEKIQFQEGINRAKEALQRVSDHV